MNAGWIEYLPKGLRSMIEGRIGLQGIIGNGAWLFADRIVRLGIGLFVGIWIARYLGPANFGKISFAVAFSALFSAMATLGLDTIAVRDLVRTPALKNEILGSVLVLKFVGGMLAFLTSLTAILIIRPNDPESHWLVGIISAGMIFQAFDTADFWFQSQVASRLSVLARSGPTLIIAAVKIALILGQADLVAFAWAATAELALTAFGLTITYRLSGNLWRKLSPAAQRMKLLLRESWPLALSGLAIMLYMRIDQVMLAEMTDEGQVGLYAAALRLSEIWYMIPAIVISSVMPSLTVIRARSEEIYYRRIGQLFSNLVRLAYAIALPMTFLATPLITLLYGESYSAAGAVLSVHIWAAVFVFLGVGTAPWIINEGLPKFSLFQTLLGASTNILLNVIFIPRYGAIGAAIATLVSQFFATFLALAFFKRTRRLFLIESNALFKFWRISV